MKSSQQYPSKMIVMKGERLPFIACENKDHPYNNDTFWRSSENYKKMGKWVIEFEKGDPRIDLLWQYIKKEIDVRNTQQIIYSAKVFKQTAEFNTQAMIIYTYDFNDTNNIYLVLKFIEEAFITLHFKNFSPKIYYKKEETTREGSNDCYSSEYIRNIHSSNNSQKSASHEEKPMVWWKLILFIPATIFCYLAVFAGNPKNNIILSLYKSFFRLKPKDVNEASPKQSLLIKQP